jgi:hypothetical protein
MKFRKAAMGFMAVAGRGGLQRMATRLIRGNLSYAAPSGARPRVDAGPKDPQLFL